MDARRHLSTQPKHENTKGEWKMKVHQTPRAGVLGIKILAGFFVGVISLLGVSREAFAHARTYVWNQEYKTLPKGIFELENHTTVQVPRMGKHSSENSWDYETELEYGLTDHWNISHYQQWETSNHDGVDDDGVPVKDVTKYGGFKFETKYRIGEKGKYWVDPLLYFPFPTVRSAKYSSGP